MSDFKFEPVTCIRCDGGDVYYLRGWPTEPQKLINRMSVLDESWNKDKPAFIEAYDTRGNMHLINTNYIIDIYIDEKAYLKKEESK